MKLSFLLLPSLLLQSVGVLASSGDRSQVFTACISSCGSNFCAGQTAPSPLPLSLRLTRWTCLDDCKYGCMHLITDDAIQSGTYIHQYYGKWPFWRLWGMQEPGSVAFSLMNLFVHLRGALLVGRRMAEGHPMKPYFLVFAVVSVNAWVWSAVFHTRGRRPSFSRTVCRATDPYSSVRRSAIHREIGLPLCRSDNPLRPLLLRCPTLSPLSSPSKSPPHLVPSLQGPAYNLVTLMFSNIHLACALPHLDAPFRLLLQYGIQRHNRDDP